MLAQHTKLSCGIPQQTSLGERTGHRGKASESQGGQWRVLHQSVTVSIRTSRWCSKGNQLTILIILGGLRFSTSRATKARTYKVLPRPASSKWRLLHAAWCNYLFRRRWRNVKFSTGLTITLPRWRLQIIFTTDTKKTATPRTTTVSKATAKDTDTFSKRSWCWPRCVRIEWR